MNEVFNFKRFGLYAVKQYSDNWKKYLILSASIFAVLLLSATVMKINRWDPHLDAFFAFLPVFSAIFLLRDMNFLRNRHTSAVQNSLPVSTTEKYLYIMLNSTVAVFILYFLAYLIVVVFAVGVYKEGAFADYFKTPENLWQIILFGLLTVQSVFFYAGTMQRKNHIWSVILILFTFMLAAAASIGIPAWISHGQSWDMLPFFGSIHEFISAGSGDTMISCSTEFPLIGGMDKVDAYTMLRWGTRLFVVLFWVAAWFNMRERSIK